MHRLSLTQSWRFGSTVAEEANVWLGVIGADLRVQGNPNRHSTLGPLDAPDAVLCRTNAGTIEALMAAHETGRRVHLVGDGKEMLSLARAAERLQAGKRAGYPELVACSAWEQVVDYAEHDAAGSDLAVAVRMIERYGTDGVIAAIDGTVPARNADLVVSIAHRSKGLEWSRRGCGSPTTTASRSTSRPVVRFPSRSLMSCSPTCRSPGPWTPSTLAGSAGSTITSPRSTPHRHRPPRPPPPIRRRRRNRRHKRAFHSG